MSNCIRFLVFLLFLFVGFYNNHLLAQQTSDSIPEVYGKRLNADADSSVWLVKLNAATIAVLKQQYPGYIKRQLSSNWFIVKKELPILSNTSIIKNYFAANYNWKLSPSLLRSYPVLSFHKQYTFLIQIADNLAFLQNVSNNREVKIISKDDKTKTVQLTASLYFVLQQLIKHPGVNFIDIKKTLPKEEMVINDYDNTVNAINLFFSTYPGVNGNGLSASVKENLFDTTDIDFKGRYLPTSNISPVITTHATTMATLVGGGGNSFHTAKGVAWGSELSSSDFANLLPDSDSSYAQYKTSVQNHSYGTGIENYYGADAAAFDQSMISNPKLVDVFSAGNSGTATDSIGSYKNVAGFANLTGSFKQAKNSITVGSVDSFYHIPPASSKGPAYDGRIKPELVAYGNDGSSGAAAITSGTVLAVQSAYALKHHDSLPDNALVKAILINSADDIFNPGPDYYSGYGNVNTYKAVRDISVDNFFYGTAKQNSIDSFIIAIPKGISHVKITLVWNDPPAQANAFTALINDLDIWAKNISSNNRWLPWVLNAAPDSVSLLSLPERKRDSLNTVEQITFSNPAKGNYVVYVKGTSITTALQPYYVAYEMDTAHTFQFITPSVSDHFVPGGKNIIRWQQTYDSTSGKLEYSTDKGLHWNLIEENISIPGKYAQWKAPDTTAITLLRMTIGSNVYVSDTFDLSKQLMPQVVLYCNDSALIKWNSINGVGEYAILQLGERYLQNYLITADTNVIIKNNSSRYLAVAPVFPGRRIGLRSYTLDYSRQGAGCYINNFLANLTADNKADLLLYLGVTENIDSIQFQQLTRNNWQTINVVQTVPGMEIHYIYPSLTGGINTFRAVAWINGNTVISNTASILYFKKADFIAKPNPLQQGQNLTVLSSTLVDGTLVIYDVLGRKLMQQELTNQQNIISTSTFAKGLYFIVIFNNKQSVYKGKFIVE